MATKAPEKTILSLEEMTYQTLDNLAILWTERTATEDAKALVARNLLDSLLEARTWVTTFEEIVAEQGL